MEILLSKTTDESRLKMTKAHLDAYAEIGLRTLMYASKTISRNEYDNWFKKY
jgi:magnesium-transporting ATPase (P-type)